MIYLRTANARSTMIQSVAGLRTLVLATLAAYPAGALVRTFGPDTLAVQGAGFALIAASLLGFILLARTRLNRIVGEQLSALDEYERDMRARAMETAYHLLGLILLFGMIYLAIASDAGLWVPSGYDQWNGLFWGLFLTANLLPTAVLAFRLPADEAAA